MVKIWWPQGVMMDVKMHFTTRFKVFAKVKVWWPLGHICN
jgi:hypothetical protein